MGMAARLGAECRIRRERARISLLEVATYAGVSQTTVHAFEQGQGWRRETDAIVDAYATLLGTTPRALWRAAIDRGGV